MHSVSMSDTQRIIEDFDVFPLLQFNRPPTFTVRNTVKAIVLNAEGKIGLVTNDVHKLYLFPGGGADSEDLEKEVRRECREELQCDVQVTVILETFREYRYRDAKEYHTTCFLAEAQDSLEVGDVRTADEQKHNLHPVWMPIEDARAILREQSAQAKKGNILYYNTAFNAVRDNLFLEKYIQRYMAF